MKNKKFFLTAGGITIFILILVLLLSPKSSTTSPSPSLAPSILSTIVPTNLSQARRDSYQKYTMAIEAKLPLFVESFETTSGITTFINIARTKEDPKEIVHLDIGGISYISKDELDESKNPNLTAFKESYLKAIDMLESQNIDPRRLLFIYSDVPYVHETASYWVDKLGLLR